MSSPLPPELVADVVQNLTISDLLRASHVCVSWRAIARGCPVFWQEIKLHASSSSAADFFIARLNQTNITGISVTIRLQWLDDLQTCVVVTLIAHMFRVEKLALRFRGSEEQSALHIVRQPADSLRTLRIDSLTMITLPEDLFAGHAPLLCELELCSVRLPPQPIAVLESCKVVILQRDHMDDVARDNNLMRFPRLESLTLDGPIHIVGPLEQPTALHEVYMDTTIDRYNEWFSALPWLTRVAVVAIGEPRPEHILKAIEGLPAGPVRVEMTLSELAEKRYRMHKPSEHLFTQILTINREGFPE
ncbi:hypothetical protein BKA62DRAFT_672207 [Auriculariales sp. MPI-PUGE-AT-0066]|nr:hypothetical protein BKA62DRAFT_672207 [Auriculariales sp. MPI-PUGE-AT-0066]